MSKQSEYLFTEEVTKIVEQADLDLDGIRLVHGCHYYVDSRAELKLGIMAKPMQKSVTARCRAILSASGAPGAKDYDMIDAGIACHANKRIFDELKRSSCGRKLKFRFSDAYVRCALRSKKESTDKFAMIDVDVIARLRSPCHVLFYTRATMAQGSKHPMFELPWIPTESKPWSAVKRRWLGAAERISTLLDHDYVLEPMVDSLTDEVFWVKVKIVKKVSGWKPQKLFPRDAEHSVCTVVSGKATTLTRQQLRERRDWTRADRR
ncbi:hypothetical protein [Roseovarius nanhaiticus]|uniref:hypothetical protein n=1 Tax=Roseovarius nanhaiticus TaxID=573024 RepID=UPI0024934D1C|nr:hypothetical protein [Roseovarius nanhaiticus]